MIIKWGIRLNILLTFLLICLGGFVHNTGSSLACPDWPLCYGELMPEMVGGVLIEHSHRLLATLVGFISVILVLVAFLEKLVTKKLFVFSLLLVIFQGILGGITVIFKLPSFVSTAHLSTSMIYFATLFYLHHIHFPLRLFRFKENVSPKLKFLLRFFLGLVFIQMVWGAAMRHLGLGSSCGIGWENGLLCQDMIAHYAPWGFPSSIEAWVHYLHRILGVSLFILFIFIFRFIPKTFSIQSWQVRWMLLILMAGQIFLGVWTAASGIDVIPTTLHLGFAALIFALTFVVELNLRDLPSINSPISNSTSSTFKDFLSLTKPRLSGLVLLTSLMGVVLAGPITNYFTVIGLLVGIMLTVAGACVINCCMEKDLDSKMKRTADRPIPSGRISAKSSVFFGGVLLSLGLGLTLLSSNLLTFILGLVASTFYVALYTPLKTRSPLAVFIGAIPGAIPPMMGFVGITGEITIVPILLFSLLFFWQIPHFLSISFRYAEDYHSAGIKVYPNVIGLRPTQWRMFWFCVLLCILGFVPYYSGITISESYLRGTLFLSVIFLILTTAGFFIKKSNSMKILEWSKMMFWGSLIYLPMQLFWLYYHS